MIHPTAIVEPLVKLGENVSVGPYTVIKSGVTIADNVKIGSHCTIGNPPQHKALPAQGGVFIDEGTILNNYVTVDFPTNVRSQTRIGKNCYLMHYSHVSHDTVLHDNVTLCNSVQIGGHSIIYEGCVLSIACIVEQRSVIGHYNFFSMGSKIRDVRAAFGKYIEGRRISDNLVAIERGGFTPEVVQEYKMRWAEGK